MFLSRKKAEKALNEVLDDQFSSVAKKIQQQIESACNTEDPAEKYLAFTTLDKQIKGYSDKVEETFLKRSSQTYVGDTLGLFATFGTTAAAIGAFAVGGWPLMFMGAASALMLSLSAAISFANNEDTAKGSIQSSCETKFGEFLKISAEQKKAILESNLPALASSRHFSMMYDSFPAVKDAFIKASARESIPRPVVILDKSGGFKPQL